MFKVHEEAPGFRPGPRESETLIHVDEEAPSLMGFVLPTVAVHVTVSKPMLKAPMFSALESIT